MQVAMFVRRPAPWVRLLARIRTAPGYGVLGRFLPVYRLRLLGALACGVSLAVAFPPYGWWALALPAVGCFTLLVHGLTIRRGAVAGLVFGSAFFAVLMDWMRVIGVDAWAGLALLEALFVAALGAGLAAVSRLRAWPLWAACLWVGEELARARVPLGGLPWGRLAFSQTATPFTPYAALGGAALVTFCVALCASLLAAAARRSVARGRPRAVAVAAATLGAVAVPAAAAAVPTPTDGSRHLTFAVVQGNVPRVGLDFLGQREAVLRNHVNETAELAARVAAGELSRPDVVIWPENSSDIDPLHDYGAYATIDAAVRQVGVPTLVGTVVDGPDRDHVQNMGIVWDPRSGPGATYVKRHPVPFGEYIPFRSVLARHIGRLRLIPADFYPGTRPGVLTLGSARIGDVICFEVAYDNLVREAVTGGGQVIVVQTNNATYGRTGQPEQQLAMSRLRAVEHGRSVVIAATSGISAIITPDGTVEARSQEFTPDLLVRSVPLRTGTTLADRVGAAPEWLLAIVGALALVGCAIRGRRARGGGGAPRREQAPKMTAVELTASTES